MGRKAKREVRSGSGGGADQNALALHYVTLESTAMTPKDIRMCREGLGIKTAVQGYGLTDRVCASSHLTLSRCTSGEVEWLSRQRREGSSRGQSSGVCPRVHSCPAAKLGGRVAHGRIFHHIGVPG